MSLVAIGEADFTLGFQLAGVQKIVHPNNLKEDIKFLLDDENLSIVLIDEVTFNKLDSRIKDEVINSIKPVFVTVSVTAQHQELRKMIRQAIGVDLLKD